MAQSLDLLTLIRPILLQPVAAMGSLIWHLLEQATASYEFVREFFANWLKLDLTTLAAAVTIFGTISSIFQVLQAVALKIYWWGTKFLTASISISANDRLNREILNWLGAQVLTRQATRVLTARTEVIQNDAWHYRRPPPERNDFHTEKRIPIQYLPTFGTTWFIHERNVFLVRRVCPQTHFASHMPAEYAAAPEGDEPLVVMCLGLSSMPIKRFFETCRDFADKQRESFITIRASKNEYHGDAWDTTILRPIRPLETVHFDEAAKAELVTDISNYLEPSTRSFYTERGIPYRRGILLWGPPGTGKTSLSLALAGLFGLELYLIHLPSIREDSELEKMFTALPPRCIVLMEDIDAVGIKRRSGLPNRDHDLSDDEDEEDEDEEDKYNRSRCSLSGVLNVLDGVSSQEGRIVIMTSNMAHKLDKALVRPGRIDRMIFLGHISQRSAELMFYRMYARETKQSPTVAAVSQDLKDEDLQKLALQFSSQIPEETFTPAELQGYLLNHRNRPAAAVANVVAWVTEEKVKKEEEKQLAKEMAAKRAKKRRAEARKLLAMSLAAGGGKDSGDENPPAAKTKETNGMGRSNDEGDEGMVSDIEKSDASQKAQPNGVATNEAADETHGYLASPKVNGFKLDEPLLTGVNGVLERGE